MALGKKKRLAILSPVPPAQTGIAYFTVLLTEYLIEEFDITIFSPTEIEQAIKLNDGLGCPILPLKDFLPSLNNESYDIVLYQIGNNKMHTGIYLIAIQHPGVVMLHEYVVHHLVKALTIGSGNKDYYTTEFIKYYGDEGAEIARLVHTGRAANETLFFHYPFYQRIVERSNVIITTTEYSKSLIEKEFPDKTILSIPICDNRLSEEIDKDVARKTLGLTDEFIFGVFGLISPAKEVDMLLDVVDSLRDQCPRLRLLLAGKSHIDYDIKKRILEKNLEEFIIFTDYLEQKKFAEWLSAADLCLNMRYPSGGESSGAMLDIMSIGKPIIVPDYAQFKEFPQDILMYVPIGRDKQEMLQKTIKYYYDNPGQLSGLTERIKRYEEENHSPKAIAEKLAVALNNISQIKTKTPPPLTKEEEQRFESLYKYFVIDEKDVIKT
jgi:glycosyltransferase involved in cell wall biosynthesis